MPNTKDDDEQPDDPVVIDISLRNQIRKERIAAVVLVLLVAGLAYVMYVNLH